MFGLMLYYSAFQIKRWVENTSARHGLSEPEFHSDLVYTHTKSERFLVNLIFLSNFNRVLLDKKKLAVLLFSVTRRWVGHQPKSLQTVGA